MASPPVPDNYSRREVSPITFSFREFVSLFLVENKSVRYCRVHHTKKYFLFELRGSVDCVTSHFIAHKVLALKCAQLSGADPGYPVAGVAELTMKLKKLRSAGAPPGSATAGSTM